jgi:hypothetical protein
MNATLVKRLGDAPYGSEEGWVGMLNLLARYGLPVAGGTVLTEDFHRRFMETSGLAEDLRRAGAEGDLRKAVAALRRKHGKYSFEGELGRTIHDALMELGGRTVAVISADVVRMGLHNIPQVRAAVLGAWLHAGGLKRQVEAVIEGAEIPTWPVLIQREIHGG